MAVQIIAGNGTFEGNMCRPDVGISERHTVRLPPRANVSTQRMLQ